MKFLDQGLLNASERGIVDSFSIEYEKKSKVEFWSSLFEKVKAK